MPDIKTGEQNYLKDTDDERAASLARAMAAAHPELDTPAPEATAAPAPAEATDARAESKKKQAEFAQQSEEAGKTAQRYDMAANILEPVAKTAVLTGSIGAGVPAMVEAGIPVADAVLGSALLQKFGSYGSEAAQALGKKIWGEGHPMLDFLAGTGGGMAAAGALGAPAFPQGTILDESGAPMNEPEASAAEGEPAPAATVPPAMSAPSAPDVSREIAPVTQPSPAVQPEVVEPKGAGEIPHTMEEMTTHAQATPFTPEQVAGMEMTGGGAHSLLKEPIDAMDTLRIHYYAANQVGQFMQLSEAANAGDEEAAAQAKDLAKELSEVTMPRWKAARHQAGLGLRALGSPASESTPMMSDVADAIDKSQGDLDYLVKTLSMLPTAAQRQSMLEMAGRGGLNNLVNNMANYYVESLLSANTVAVKGATDTFQALMSPFERQAAEGVGVLSRAAGTPPEETVAPGETHALVTGAAYAFKDAVRTGWEAAKNDQPLFAAQEGYGEALPPRGPSITGETFGPDSQIGNAVKYLGQLIHLPVRGIIGINDFSHVMNYRAQVNALAYRQAYWESAGTDDPEATFADLFAKYQAKPTPEMVEQAGSYTSRQMLGEDMNLGGPTGSLLEGVKKLRAESGIARFVLPFWPTIVNLQRLAMTWSPLAPLSRSFWNQVQAGGASRDLAIARMALGSGMATAWYLAHAEGHMEGSGPANPEISKLWQGEQGHQPYSLEIGPEGDKVDMSRLPEPLKTQLQTFADASEIMSHASPDDRDDIGAVMALLFSRYVSEQTLFENLNDVAGAFGGAKAAQAKINAVNEMAGQMTPEAAQAYEEANAPSESGLSEAQSAMRHMAGSLVPATVRDIAHWIDPTHRQVNSYLDAIKANIPGLSMTLEPEVDLFGKPVVLPSGWNRYTGGLISLFKTSKVDDRDDVINTLTKLNPPIPTIGNDGMTAIGTAGAMNKIPVTAHQIYEMSVLRGQLRNPDAGYKTLHEYLAETIHGSDFQSADPLTQRRMLSTIITGWTQEAKNAYMMGAEATGLDAKALEGVDPEIRRQIEGGGAQDMRAAYEHAQRNKMVMHEVTAP